jgi:hypothetical protein
MNPRPSIRVLDPLGDPPRTPPDGEVLLRRLVVEPGPRAAAGTRRRRRLPPLAPAAVAIAAAGAAIALITPANDEQAVPEGAPGSGVPVVHYVVRETYDGERPQFMGTTEIWRLDDGSRARVVSRYGDFATEEVVTESERLTFIPQQSPRPGGPTIIRYRAGDDFGFVDDPTFEPPAFGAPPIVRGEVGDPRTLPLRAERGEDGVSSLGAATVGDTAVRQFRVGDCSEPTRTRALGGGMVATDVAEYAVVSLARDTGFPVRVVIRACDSGEPSSENRTLDFTAFEELPATAENLAQLEMSPHPGVPIVDGVKIDRQEERDEAADAVPTPTPTPQSTPTPAP